MVTFSPEDLATSSGISAGGGATLIGTLAPEAAVEDHGDQGPRAMAQITPVRYSQHAVARRGGGKATTPQGGGSNNRDPNNGNGEPPTNGNGRHARPHAGTVQQG